MMAYDLSKALNTNFSVRMSALPNIELFLTDSGIPDVIGMAATAYSGYGIDIPLLSDKIEYSPLILGFVIDEHFHNYEEIYHWILPPNNYLNREASTLPTTTIYVDILDNRKVATLRFEFVDAFPTSIGSVQLDHQGSAEQLQSTIEFRYSYFRLKRLQGTSPPVARITPIPNI